MTAFPEHAHLSMKTGALFLDSCRLEMTLHVRAEPTKCWLVFFNRREWFLFLSGDSYDVTSSPSESPKKYKSRIVVKTRVLWPLRTICCFLVVWLWLFWAFGGIQVAPLVVQLHILVFAVPSEPPRPRSEEHSASVSPVLCMFHVVRSHKGRTCRTPSHPNSSAE